MDSPSSLHPTDRTLDAFALGRLDEGSTEAVRAHLESCADCRRRASEITADSFLERVRGGAGTSSADRSRADGTMTYGGTYAKGPPPAETLPPGLVDHPDYEIRRELGRGGMGVVYLAHNRLMGRDEVLKVMGRQIMERPGVLERFVREIRAVARLRHPNIVTAYAATRVGDSIVFAMEYVEGLDLSRLVKAKGPLPVAHACNFAHQAALGLQHAHEEGLVHRDIKPGNLMLARKGDRPLVKVLDFGLSKAARSERVDGGLTHEGQALGTPDSIAPEQILNAPDVDIRADIYSLGGTLYYLLTGRPPFRGNSLYDIYQAHISRDADPLQFVRPEVPAELASIVAKMLAKEPARRFQTPAEVAEALKPFFKRPSTPGQATAPEISRMGQSDPGAASATPAPPAGAGRATAAERSGTRVPPPASPGTSPASVRTVAEPVGPKSSGGDAPGGLDLGIDAGPRPDPAPETAAGPRRGRVGRRGLALAAGGAGLLALLGVVLYVATDTGTITIALDDPSAVLRVDGQVVRIEQLGEPITVRAGAHDMVVTRGDGESQTRQFVVRRGGNEAIRVAFEPKVAAAEPGPPPTVPVPTPSPAAVTDRRPDPVTSSPPPAAVPASASNARSLPLNRWVELDPSEGSARPWQTPVERNTVRDGVVTMAAMGHIYFPTVRGRDMAIRARVQVPRNNRIQMLLRSVDDANYIGGFYRVGDGSVAFGFIKTVGGKWSDLPGGKWMPATAFRDDEFVEIEFSVVGDTLTLKANGRTMLETRDTSLQGASGSPGFQVNKSPGTRLKDIQVKILKE